MARPMTREEHKQGYSVCGCGEYVHVWKNEVLRRLPKDYHGERCPECNLWMCHISKLNIGARMDDERHHA